MSLDPILVLKLLSEVIELTTELKEPLDNLTPQEILDKINERKVASKRFRES